MEWVKLKTNYYLDPAVMRAGEDAEVLFTRAMAYVGDQETDGVIPREVLARLAPTRAAARVRALVREGLWIEIPEGWRFASWHDHQTTKESLDRAREGNRRRQATHRARRNGVRNAVTNAEVTRTELEQEVDAAAAAPAQPVENLPGELQILRTKLDAHNLRVRWDRLTHDQATEIVALVHEHGDNELIRAAQRAFQPANPIVYAQGWLSTWRDIRKPGHLALVEPLCPTHTFQREPASTCKACASERLAGEARC